MDKLRMAGVALALAGALTLVEHLRSIARNGASPLRDLPTSVALLVAGIGLILAPRTPRGKDAAAVGFGLLAIGILFGFLSRSHAGRLATLGGLSALLAVIGAALLAVASWQWRERRPSPDLFRVGSAMLIVGVVAPVARFIGLVDPLTFLLPLALLVAGLVLLAMAPPSPTRS